MISLCTLQYDASSETSLLAGSCTERLIAFTHSMHLLLPSLHSPTILLPSIARFPLSALRTFAHSGMVSPVLSWVAALRIMSSASIVGTSFLKSSGGFAGSAGFAGFSTPTPGLLDVKHIKY